MRSDFVFEVGLIKVNTMIQSAKDLRANAVVNKSFPEGNCTLVGVPAHKVGVII